MGTGSTIAPAGRMNTVQIALRNLRYALALRRLLMSDGRHDVRLVRRPDPAIGGVMVIDERFRKEIEVFDQGVLARAIVFLRKGDWTKLSETGIQNVIQADCPAFLGFQAILALEEQLTARAAAFEISEELRDLRNAIAGAIWESAEVAKALENFNRRGREVQIEFDAVVVNTDRHSIREARNEKHAGLYPVFDDADKSFLQALKISVP